MNGESVHVLPLTVYPPSLSISRPADRLKKASGRRIPAEGSRRNPRILQAVAGGPAELPVVWVPRRLAWRRTDTLQPEMHREPEPSGKLIPEDRAVPPRPEGRGFPRVSANGSMRTDRRPPRGSTREGALSGTEGTGNDNRFAASRHGSPARRASDGVPPDGLRPRMALAGNANPDGFPTMSFGAVP
jgi:hypothetical protein